MDGAAIAWAWFLGVFIIFLLPLITLAAVAFAVRYREKTGRWKGRPLVILSVWALFVAGDVPLKLVLLGWSCMVWGGVWVADDFDPSFRPPSAWRSAVGCDQQCLDSLDSDPTAVVQVYVVDPDAAAHAETAGYFEYWRSTVPGHPSCLLPWREVKAKMGAAVTPRLVDDAGRDDCLARSTPANPPDILRFRVSKDTVRPTNILFMWRKDEQLLTELSSGKVVASIRDYSIPMFWWVPGWVLSCPNTPLDVSIEDIRSGSYPKQS